MALNDPVPSNAFDVLQKNMEVADEFVNSTSNNATTRGAPNGNPSIRTIAGINKDADDTLKEFLQSANVILPPVAYGSGQIVDSPSGAGEYAINQGFTYSGATVRFAGPVTDLPYDLSQPFDNSKWTPVSTNDGYTADQLSRISPANIDWDVNLPFGNKLIDTLSGPLSFTRMSIDRIPNLSGIVGDVGIDAPAIVKGGIRCYESVTNKIFWSEDFSNPVWGTGGGTVITYGSESSPERLDTASRATPGTSSTPKQIFQNIQVADGVSFTSSVCVKADGYRYLQFANTSSIDSTLSFVNFDSLTGEITRNDSNLPVKVEPLIDGWYRVSVTFVPTDTVSGGVNFIIIDSALSGRFVGFTGDGTSGVLLWGASVTETDYFYSYSRTESAETTTSSSVTTIEASGNLPTSVGEFTICIDSDISDMPTFSTAFSLPGNTGAISTNGSSFYFELKNTDGTTFYSGFTGFIPSGLSRHVARYDGENISYFVDGELISSGSFSGTPAFGTSPNMGSTIGIGSRFDGSNPCNIDIKNFRVAHRALSDDQIKALGGPNNA